MNRRTARESPDPITTNRLRKLTDTLTFTNTKARTHLYYHPPSLQEENKRSVNNTVAINSNFFISNYF